MKNIASVVLIVNEHAAYPHHALHHLKIVIQAAFARQDMFEILMVVNVSKKRNVQV